MIYKKDINKLIEFFQNNYLDIERNKGKISVYATNKKIKINYYESTGNIQIQWAKTNEVKEYYEKLIMQFIKNGNVFKNEEEKEGVYIIHGTNQVPRLELELLLQKLNINAIVSMNETSGGLHLINGVLRDFEKTNYAIAILANDDFITINNPSKEPVIEKRARQNVILEIGMWIGKYGTDNLLLLLQKGTTIPSDLNGIIYKEFENSVKEIQNEIINELKAHNIIE